MNLNDVLKIKEMLKDNNFKELDFNENPEDFENYYPSSEIARRLDYRLLGEEMSQVLSDLGYKTFVEKTGVPSNPENSAFAVKFITDDETLERKYYIQPLWDNSVIEQINETMEKNPEFLEKIPSIVERNKKEMKEKIKKFKIVGDFVSVVVKKTGFNEEKDFVIYVSLAKYVNGELTDNLVLPLNDGIDDEKLTYYYEQEPLTEMAPFNYIRVNIKELMENGVLLDRKEALRRIFKIINGQNLVYFNIEESRFLKKMFKDENIPEQYSYENIILGDYDVKSVIDWIDQKKSLKIRDVYKRYDIPYDVNDDKFLQESKRLGMLIKKVKERVA